MQVKIWIPFFQYIDGSEYNNYACTSHILIFFILEQYTENSFLHHATENALYACLIDPSRILQFVLL